MNQAGLFGELLLGVAALLAEPREAPAEGFSAEIDGRRARYSPLCNDGFGNLTTVNVTKGTAPSLSVSYNAATNRRTTDTADANGNILQSGVTNYDVENRITAANITNGTARYSYAPGNKRIWRGTWVNSAQTVDELSSRRSQAHRQHPKPFRPFSRWPPMLRKLSMMALVAKNLRHSLAVMAHIRSVSIFKIRETAC